MAVAHKGAISFGLVHIPISLHTATQDNDIRFNQLCKADHSRICYKKVCASCGKEVGANDIIKGFEYEDGKYVTVSEEERVCPPGVERSGTDHGKNANRLHGQTFEPWIAPELACTVKFMERTRGGGMRQPVFKGLREDKTPQECKISKNE